MRTRLVSCGILLMALLCCGRCCALDVVELLTGVKFEGQVKSIDKDKKLVTFTANIGGQTIERVYPYGKIHAVTYQGKRYVLTEKTAAPDATLPSGGLTSKSAGTSNANVRRTPAQVKSLIEEAGKSPPEWYDSVPVEHPPTLDLSWPPKPPEGWDNKKNVGQYLWDVINPNPNRWKSGVRLIHHLLSMHQNDEEKRHRAMKTLGAMYFNLFQDYPRAAFWWQQAGIRGGDPDGIGLAECYWRLGDRKTAEQFLADPEHPRPNNTLQIGMIKLWGDMGETTKAVKLSEWWVRSGGQSHLAYLFAADACRLSGRYPEAIRFYQKAIDASGSGEKGRVDQTKQRAQNSLEAVKLIELLDLSRVADGKYHGSSRGYEAPIEVEVAVAGGRIESVRVAEHHEKQFYSALTDIPNQIIKKQGVKGVEATSRATITAEAIINATAKALSK